MKFLRVLVVVGLASLGLAIGASGAGAGGFPVGTCTGGSIGSPTPIPTGVYQGMTVTGICAIAPGTTVDVRGKLTLGPAAGLIAAIDGSSGQQLTVQNDVIVGPGAALILGCTESAGCSTTTTDYLNGNLIGNQPLMMIIHGNKIRGNVTVNGGGDHTTDANCADDPSAVFNAFEDNNINGAATITGYQACWMGFIRNQVRGDVTITNNILADPDANEVSANLINGRIWCQGNTPAAQFGDGAPIPNQVRGAKLAECAPPLSV